jgi:hypothetical protein
MILLRLGVGTGAAAILYFVFEAGLVDGLLFPDLNAIGFGPVLLGGGEGEALSASLENLRNALTSSAERAEALAGRLGEAVGALAATAPGREALGGIGTELAGLGEALDRLGGEIGPRRDTELGRYVPNPHLSKLVVWSFLAGFSEMLVPNILGRVEAGAETT